MTVLLRHFILGGVAESNVPVPHFRVPLNLPHACTLASRIIYHLSPRVSDPAVIETAEKMFALLAPFRQSGENPPGEEGKRVAAEAAALARSLVDDIDRLRAGHDRLGQAVRNFFECLELGEEGAIISLRAGENPKSILRPQ